MRMRLVVISLAAIALVTRDASAKWMACCTNGIAYTADTLSGQWTPAGGCADGPWMIEYRAIPSGGGKKVDILKQTVGSLPVALERQRANDTFTKPKNRKEWVARLQERGKP